MQPMAPICIPALSPAPDTVRVRCSAQVVAYLAAVDTAAAEVLALSFRPRMLRPW